jgi:hypothetical protein
MQGVVMAEAVVEERELLARAVQHPRAVLVRQA